MKERGFAALVVIILGVLLLAGLGFYYLQIYRPAKFAKDVVSLFDEVTTGFQKSEREYSQAKDKEGVLKLLRARQELFVQTRDKLLKLSPPAKMRQVKDDFEASLDWFIAANRQAQERVQFLSDFTDFKNYTDLEAIVSSEPKPKNVGELNSKIDKNFQKAKEIGGELFQVEQTWLTGPTFSDLETSWQNAQADFQILLEFLDAQDQNSSFDALSQAAEQNPEVNAAADRLTKFTKLLDDFYSQSSSLDLSGYTFFTNPPQREIKEHMERLDIAIRALKEKYPQ